MRISDPRTFNSRLVTELQIDAFLLQIMKHL